jgi:hypothetical protein
VVKKRTASRATSRKSAKSAKGAKKKAATRRPTVLQPGAGYQTKAGVDLRPLKKAIRLTIERLAKSKETPKVASALESLVAVQQRLTADCDPTMVLPNS